jgi:hypothetical protein
MQITRGRALGFDVAIDGGALRGWQAVGISRRFRVAYDARQSQIVRQGVDPGLHKCGVGLTSAELSPLKYRCLLAVSQFNGSLVLFGASAVTTPRSPTTGSLILSCRLNLVIMCAPCDSMCPVMLSHRITRSKLRQFQIGAPQSRRTSSVAIGDFPVIATRPQYCVRSILHNDFLIPYGN